MSRGCPRGSTTSIDILKKDAQSLPPSGSGAAVDYSCYYPIAMTLAGRLAINKGEYKLSVNGTCAIYCRRAPDKALCLTGVLGVPDREDNTSMSRARASQSPDYSRRARSRSPKRGHEDRDDRRRTRPRSSDHGYGDRDRSRPRPSSSERDDDYNPSRRGRHNDGQYASRKAHAQSPQGVRLPAFSRQTTISSVSHAPRI